MRNWVMCKGWLVRAKNRNWATGAQFWQTICWGAVFWVEGTLLGLGTSSLRWWGCWLGLGLVNKHWGGLWFERGWSWESTADIPIVQTDNVWFGGIQSMHLEWNSNFIWILQWWELTISDLVVDRICVQSAMAILFGHSNGVNWWLYIWWYIGNLLYLSTDGWSTD
jgi:hypothetical protein